MIIEKLNLKNFRNYKKLELNFSSKINFIIGDNGSGKSNILEAISILSNIKSFRNASDSDIIKWGSDSYYCSVFLENSDYNKFELGTAYLDNKIKKKFKIDDIEIKKASEYYGKLLTVTFSPEDINLINGSPEIRRRYFDSFISKLDNEYFIELSNFRKILVSRNIHLKKIRDNKLSDFNELYIWDKLFSEKSSEIIKKREKYIKKLSSIFCDEYNKISKVKEAPLIIYKNNLKNNNEFIYNELLKNRKIDILRGTTSIGPQRDDYLIKSENLKFTQYASQGQKRTASIALKISEKKFIESHTGKKVILLIDDILSELDKKRKINLIENIYENNQVIFTMVNISDLDKDLFLNANIYNVNEGSIVNEI